MERIFAGLACVIAAILAGTAARSAPQPAGPAIPVEERELPGTYRLSDRLFSGPRPAGDSAFAALAKMGVKTIVSVDGIATDVEAARRHGLRYIHLPVPYKQMERSRALEIIKASQSSAGPVYLHCHYGRHRGPSAGALVMMASGDWNHETARAWLEQAGTNPDYPGLWEQVRTFQAPTSDELADINGDFPECTPPTGLAESMVAIEALWEGLPKEASAARKPEAREDASQLVEEFRELTRLDKVKEQGEDFQKLLDASRAAAQAYYDALRQEMPADEKAFNDARERVEQSCKDCHAKRRDR